MTVHKENRRPVHETPIPIGDNILTGFESNGGFNSTVNCNKYDKFETVKSAGAMVTKSAQNIINSSQVMTTRLKEILSVYKLNDGWTKSRDFIGRSMASYMTLPGVVELQEEDIDENVDGGWAWVVCLSAFFAHFLSLGFAYSLGVYYVVFLRVFDSGSGVTAWISSLNYGVCCAVGPLASILISNLGCRGTVIIGALVSTAGLIISSQVNDIYALCVTLGALTGAGMGLVVISGIVVISYWFSKYRPLAMGLSVSGAGFGLMTFPWMNQFLVDRFGWRGALMIAAAINLNLLVCGAVMRPREIRSTQEQELNKTNKVKDSTPAWRTFHLDLFQRPAFWCLAINNFLFTFGLGVVYTHVDAYARSLAMSANTGSILISSVGVSNLLGRIGLGAFGQLQFVDVPLLFLFAYLIAGLSIIAVGIWQSFVGILLLLITFGFFSAGYGPLLSEVTCQVTGITKFNHGYGYMLLFMAVGTTFGAPCAGALYEVSQYYPASFFLGGGFIIGSSLVLLPVATCFHPRRSILSTLETESEEDLPEVEVAISRHSIELIVSSV